MAKKRKKAAFVIGSAKSRGSLYSFREFRATARAEKKKGRTTGKRSGKFRVL